METAKGPGYAIKIKYGPDMIVSVAMAIKKLGKYAKELIKEYNAHHTQFSMELVVFVFWDITLKIINA